MLGGLIQFLVALGMILFTLFYCFRDGEWMVAVLADWISFGRGALAVLCWPVSPN